MKKFIYAVLLIMIICFNMNVYASDKVTVELKKCVDGDTARFLLKNKEIKTRFLAIDTPESVHPTVGVEAFGKEASEYTCEKLTNAKKIVLEYDPESDKTDKYDRHLVWVFVDDVLLQKDLISKGYAQVDYLYGDYKYVSELKKVEEKAKEQKIGIWSEEQVTEETDVSKEKNKGQITIEKDEIKGLLNSILEILKKLLDFVETIVNDVL